MSGQGVDWVDGPIVARMLDWIVKDTFENMYATTRLEVRQRRAAPGGGVPALAVLQPSR